MSTEETLNLAANNIRILAASMVEKAKSGHPGGAMGGADYVNVLFSKFLQYDPSDPTWIGRDRFFLDPGHMSPMLYSVLALTGKFTMEELSQFRQWGSPTAGHPEVDIMRGIENTSGPLGQGHVMAVGSAIAERFLCARFGEWMSHKTYAYISDGGVQEEISQGAGRLAGKLGLSNLIMFYDSNDIQLSTECNAVTDEDTAAKYRAWNWNVMTVNGSNASELISALESALKEKEKPTLIIGKTIMGKGAVGEDGSSFEHKCCTHGNPLSAAGASFDKTIQNLGGDPKNPFVIFPEVVELYENRKKELIKLATEKKAIQAKWEKENPELATKLKMFFSKEAPKVDWSKVEQKADQATRSASATALAFMAKNIENMVVSSADLSNSDKTDGFLKNTKAFKKGDFSGSFLQAGVSELTMASIMVGMALHGGVIPACGTFFVFSDYMKPVVRVAALMRVPVIFIWSHDAFRVGEDGPTHQPIEQEAQIRLMEQVKNHAGKSSMLVLRPCDAEETTVAWKMAVENKETPSALILSRQNIKNLPGDRKVEAFKAEKGAYIVTKDENPEVVLIANGSEVSTLVEASALLKQRDGIQVQIVAVPSEGRFREQSEQYQEEVIPSSLPAFGLTAGLPSTLRGLVGAKGKVWGLDHFGYSAPYKILDEKFGFTPENVYTQVKQLLSK